MNKYYYTSDEDEGEDEDEDQIEKPYMRPKIIAFLGISLILLGCLYGQMLNDGYESQYKGSDSMKIYIKNFTKDAYAPQQIHLSLGSDETELYLTWNTRCTVQSRVFYNELYPDGSIGPKRIVEGNLTTWTSTERDPIYIRDLEMEHMAHYTYRAVLKDLQPNRIYQYVIEAKELLIHRVSPVYSFKTKNLTNPDEKVSLAFYGDLGLTNGQSIPRLIKDIDEKKYDFIIHNGDFAYDLDSFFGMVGDQFMREIEPIAARVPYQTSVGNHEIAELFLHYDQRFSMISSGGKGINNFYYSFNAGPIHFVAISTEHWYFLDWVGIKSLHEQWEWLKKDLAQANEPKTREVRPWIIVYGHRPMYCSGRDKDDCSKDTCLLRKGLPFLGTFNLEKLLYESGVDIGLWSHEHQYERFLPLYNGTVLNGTDSQNPYHNGRAPVHITSGSAGCDERIEFFDRKAPGSVVQIAEYGYTRIKSSSRCRIEFEQVSDDRQGAIVDNFVITKTRQNFPENQTAILLSC